MLPVNLAHLAVALVAVLGSGNAEMPPTHDLIIHGLMASRSAKVGHGQSKCSVITVVDIEIDSLADFDVHWILTVYATMTLVPFI